MARRLPLLLLLALSRVRGVVGGEERIKISSVDEFKGFVRNVNNNKGTSYEGTTVYLDADLDFTGETTDPIGKRSDSNKFCGTFDGQGYIISGLKISSSSLQHTGLFGYSSGLTIKNVVLDGSCSITSSHDGESYVGGIIWKCEANSGQCNIENTVNMANVTFSGQANSNIFYLGGIAGLLKTSSNYPIYVKNCANYGSVTYSGTGSDLRIGGIAGSLDSDTSCALYVRNTINYGEVKYSGTLPRGSNFNAESSLGGITGSSFKNIYFENCVSAGNITSREGLKTGSIVGYVYDNTYINYCYYTKDVSYNLYGTGTPTSTEGTPNNSSSLNSTLIDNLNGYASGKGWSKWLLNENGKNVSFSINNRNKLNTMKYKIILLPDLAGDDASNSNAFDGWYIDSECTKPLKSFEVAGDTTFYGLYGAIVVVTFDANGGDKSFGSKNVVFGLKYGTLPDANKTGYTFSGWFNESNVNVTNETMVSNSNGHTLTAHWTANEYTVTFDANGGSVSEPPRRVTYDSKYGTLPDPTREGYNFSGWFNESEGGNEVKSETVVNIADDHTLYAHWIINNYTLTFDFNNSEDPDVRILNFNHEVDYPSNPEREGYTFNGWNKSDVKFMPAHNLTITAQWTINNYTLTFDFNNGAKKEVKTLNYNQKVDYPESVTREGYTFNGWDKNDVEFMPAQDLTITAQWTINNYTLTFDFDNETDPEARTLNYNQEVVYPPNPTRKGHTFNEWDKNITNMPAYNLTITAQWTPESQKNKKSSVGTIAGVVIPMFIIIIAALIILILFILKRRKEDYDDDDESRSRNSTTGSDSERKVELGRSLLDDDDRQTERYVPADRYNRVVPKSKYEKKIKPVVGPPKLDLKDLFPAGYARPAMKDALLEAGFTEKQADTICATCNEAAQGVAASGNLPSGFTEADAAAIAMYTYDFGEKDGENSPFGVINKSLAGTSYDDLRKVSGLLYLVLAALRKLDRVMGSTLYRGVQGKMNLEEEGYTKGSVVTWMALASVSSDIEATKRVVGADEEGEKKKKKKKPGTLFIIEDGWGYDIQPYSLYPGEEEILFEPERRFIVTSVIQSTELTFINLKMLDTPLSMPQINKK